MLNWPAVLSVALEILFSTICQLTLSLTPVSYFILTGFLLPLVYTLPPLHPKCLLKSIFLVSVLHHFLWFVLFGIRLFYFFCFWPIGVQVSWGIDDLDLLLLHWEQILYCSSGWFCICDPFTIASLKLRTQAWATMPGFLHDSVYIDNLQMVILDL